MIHQALVGYGAWLLSMDIRFARQLFKMHWPCEWLDEGRVRIMERDPHGVGILWRSPRPDEAVNVLMQVIQDSENYWRQEFKEEA